MTFEKYGIPEVEGTPVLRNLEDDFDMFRTGLFSFDWLMGFRNKPGVLYSTLTELYGEEGVGKSTLAYYLGGKPRPNGTFLIADLESSAEHGHVAMNAARAGFNGTIEFILRSNKGKARSHAEMVTELCDRVLDEEVVTTLLDSVGAYMPVAEAKAGDITDTIWGRRAQEVGKMARRINNNLIGKKSIAFLVNHQLQVMGSPYLHNTPGGKAMKYMCDYRLWMRRKETVLGTCNWVKINTEKKRYGGNKKDRFGYVFIIPDHGVSPKMTAVFDCFELGLAKRPTGSASVTVGGNKICRLRKLIELAISGEEPEKFLPFFQALVEYEKENFITED